MSKFKAKIGDKIVITKSGYYLGRNYKKGEVWIVCHETNDFIYASGNGEYKDYVLLDETEYELASELASVTKPIPKYNVGEGVKFIDDASKGYYCCSPGQKLKGLEGPGIKGHKGLITEIKVIEQDVWYLVSGFSNWITEEAIEGLVIPKPTPDKTPTCRFIEGKWYKVDGWQYCYYLKFKWIEKLKDYDKVYGEIINSEDNKTYKDHDYLANSDMQEKLVLLGDLSEIQNYLPDGHPDKIVIQGGIKFPKYARTKFLLNPSEININNTIPGKIYKVEDGRLDIENGDYCWYETCNFSPATEEEYKAQELGHLLYSGTIGSNSTQGSYNINPNYTVTTNKTKNEHVVHQTPVMIRKTKKVKQLFIVNN